MTNGEAFLGTISLLMANQIPQRQNSETNLRRLEAQRQSYSEAKRFVALQVVLAVPAPLGWSAVAAIWPATAVWAAFWGIGSSILDAILFEFLIDSKKRTAARIQELFDCDLFELPWSAIIADNTPDPELVAALAARGSQKSSNGMLKDWYPPRVGAVNLAQARLLCQRTNLWWDVELRSRLFRWLTAILLFVGASVTI